MKVKDWFGVAAVIAFGLMCLPGCGPREPYLTKQYALHGPCLFWGGIEKKSWGQDKCDLPWPHDPAIKCTRQEGHKSRHHSHHSGSCLAYWK